MIADFLSEIQFTRGRRTPYDFGGIQSGKLNIIGIRSVGIPVLDSGILQGFIGTAIDVTSREERRQELGRRVSR